MIPTLTTADKHLIVICGPTGIGKTETAIQLACHFQTEIISADSRQFFKELKIGTATPSEEELKRAKHHFIGHLSIQNEYNIYQYEKDALALLEDLFKSQSILILCGGSGLYIDAVCKGIDDIPDVEPEIRSVLIERLENEGVESLRQELRYIDPKSYTEIDLKNPKRILRALEVSMASGKPFSSFKLSAQKERKFKIHTIVLDMDREKLYERIDDRVDRMILNGLEDEVRSLIPYRQHNALKTVGYTEFFNYFDGKTDLEEAIRLIKRNSRRYAKRQISWFGRNPEAVWMPVSDQHRLIKHLNQRISL